MPEASVHLPRKKSGGSFCGETDLWEIKALEEEFGYQPVKKLTHCLTTLSLLSQKAQWLNDLSMPRALCATFKISAEWHRQEESLLNETGEPSKQKEKHYLEEIKKN